RIPKIKLPTSILTTAISLFKFFSPLKPFLIYPCQEALNVVNNRPAETPLHKNHLGYKSIFFNFGLPRFIVSFYSANADEMSVVVLKNNPIFECRTAAERTLKWKISQLHKSPHLLQIRGMDIK